jgi:hypothetical protein
VELAKILIAGKALERIESVLKEDPENVDAALVKSSALLAGNNADGALQLLL